MMNNGITFGDQGPLMDGTWYNPSTGDSFTVRDSFFEDGQYMVTTMDGRMLGYNMIQNYIKSDKPINMPKKTQEESLPSEVESIIAPDDFNELEADTDIYGINGPKLGNLSTPTTKLIMEHETSNTSIIAKALNKSPKPEVVADIIWKDFPKRQIEMLNEIMEIDMREIVEWYAAQLDTTEIAIAIHNSIINYINDQLYGRILNTVEIDTTLESEKAIKYEPINAVAEESRMFVDETSVKSPKKSTPKKTTKKAKK